MADLEARRAARRQRILHSSQDRMKRVLGASSDSSQPISTSRVVLDSSGDTLRRDEATTYTENTSEKTDLVSSDTELIHRKPGSVSENSTVKESEAKNRQPIRNTVKISPLKKPVMTETSEISDGSLNVSRSTSEAKMMLKHFEFLRIVLCFMVGFLCRKLLSSGYGVFYVQTIVLPFVCLEAGFFIFKQHLLHNIQLPHRSSLLIGLLMLCGIKPAILTLYNKIMGYVTAASEDFAMFLFAFFMSHLFV